MSDVGRIYLDDMRAQFRKLQATAERAMGQASDAAFFAAPDAETNSIAITVKHVSGNLASRFTDLLTTDGEKPDRRRDDEFVLGPADTREALLARWAAAWATLHAAVDALTADDLERTIHIRREPHSVIAALGRSLSHLAYHVGQMVLLAKHYAGPSWKTLTIARGESETYAPPVSTGSANPTARRGAAP